MKEIRRGYRSWIEAQQGIDYTKYGSYLPQRRKGRKEIQILITIKTQTNRVKSFCKINA